MAFVREQQIYTRRERGEEMKEVHISVISEGQKKYYSERRRRKKTAVTSPKQKTLNDRYAQEHFEQLANTNFGKNDLLLTTTYADRHLPTTADEGDGNVQRMLRRLAKTYAKLGVPFRYIFTTSFSTGCGESKEIVRMHHHILLSGGVPREVIEDAWRAKSDKPGQLGELLGFANVKRLQPDESGITAVCVYFFRQAREGIRRRWHASIGLKKPLAVTPNDESYDFRDLERIRVRGSDAPEVSFWERRYPGWTLAGLGAVTVRESELSGTSVRVRLRKNQDKKVQKARKGGLKA